MKLSKNWKIVIGILTVLQLFVGLFFLIWFFTSVIPILMTGDDAAIEAMFLASLGGFLVGTFLMAILSMGITIFYIVHAASNKSIGTGMKILWILLVFFFGSIVQVAYFFMEVVPEKSMTARIEEN
jgi:hypothetical protein